MPTHTLSSDISETITVLEILFELDPANIPLSEKIQKMYDALQQAEGREWDAHIECYQLAKTALEQARNETKQAIADLSKTAKAMNKVGSAIEKMVAALVFVV